MHLVGFIVGKGPINVTTEWAAALLNPTLCKEPSMLPTDVLAQIACRLSTYLPNVCRNETAGLLSEPLSDNSV
jgi:hypothetical protein